MTIDLADLEKIRDATLQEFEQRVRAVESEAGGDFDLEVAKLESQGSSDDN